MQAEVQPVAHAPADFEKAFAVRLTEEDGLAETTAEQQRLEGPRADDDRGNGQRDERPEHRRHFLPRRAAMVAVGVLIMSTVIMSALVVIAMRPMPDFGVCLVLLILVGM